MMFRLSMMYKQFVREPLWFKFVIISSLLISILFSSSFFSEQGYYQSIAKWAAAIFFLTYGIKFRRNTKVAVVFFVLMGVSIYLSWGHLK